MYDVLIIGAGIIGAAAAFTLSSYDVSVAVLEAENDVSCGTTRANSAILHAGYDPKPGSLMAKLGVRGSVLAKELCARLDVPYAQIGSLVLGFSEENKTMLTALLAQGRANGVPNLALLTGDEARAREPNISPDATCALFAPTAAICSPWDFCFALMENAVHNGVNLQLETPVTALTKTQNGWRVDSPRGSFEARYILNAAGVCAADVHAMASDCPFSISPSRGQYYLLDKAEGNRVSSIIFQCPGPAGKGVLVAPTVYGNLIVGPNAEPAAAGDTATTDAGLAFVKSSAQKSVPSVDFRQNIRSFAGLRAVASTGDFILEEAAGAAGFFDLAGVCSPGLSAAAAIGEYAAKLLEEGGLCLAPKADFSYLPHRVHPPFLPPEKRAALVRERPAFGHIICRCEGVSEGEILDAMEGPIPPRSLDGIKRRCGPGSGRCQGGFCAPKVLELLCKKSQLSPTELPQDLVGSWMLAGETKGGGGHV